MRVLIVDDDQEIRETLHFAFDDAGYSVALAADGIAALDLLRASTEPTVVLLDLMMPRLGGEGVLQAVAQDPNLSANHAYILMTATHRTFPLAFMNMLTHLKIAIMAKPLDIDQLFAQVERSARRLPSRIS